MSAILSADNLNDFILPGVACINPIETLPPKQDSGNPYEVTTEEKAAAANAPPAKISLTDCLACSGCVTSAEAVLVSLQSHNEVLKTLDEYPSLLLPWAQNGITNDTTNGASNATSNGTKLVNGGAQNAKLFVASVSPQARASLAATYGISERQAGYLVEQLLCGSHGLKSGGPHGSSFTWVIDTNTLRDAALVLAADEVIASIDSAANGVTIEGPSQPKKPILTSACPGWICYAEKTHPYVLPHLSRLKSPQALAGTLMKSVLGLKYGLPPNKIWHLAVMPCFDKKLEASRTELTSTSWLPASALPDETPVRDVDCVITARELLHLATARGISMSSLPMESVRLPPFPDPVLDSFLFSHGRRRVPAQNAGSSGGYLYHIIHTLAAMHPGTDVRIERGRNADVVEYKLVNIETGQEVIKMARYYGFRNIQNLVRRLKPKTASRMPGAVSRGPAVKSIADTGGHAYVEVMACPGGCTNGGGQIKIGEVSEIRGDIQHDGLTLVDKPSLKEQKEWLAKVDEAYYSADSSSDAEYDYMDIDKKLATPSDSSANGHIQEHVDMVGSVSRRYTHSILDHWANITGVDKEKLVWTSFREVVSDVGKSKGKKSDMERVAGLASSVGGGW